MSLTQSRFNKLALSSAENIDFLPPLQQQETDGHFSQSPLRATDSNQYPMQLRLSNNAVDLNTAY